MRYIESPSTDPTLNLALEQYVFDTLSCNDDFCLLWKNTDCVIVGIHQNIAEEVNRAFIERNGIPALRRLSGGGAVFHDLGNINFSFITSVPDAGKLDSHSSCRPVIEVLEELGIRAEYGGRNDLAIGGRKFSGNARYLRSGRLMHHGTILFDTDLGKMSEALRPARDEIISNSVKSVRAQVANLRDHLPVDMTAGEFWAFFCKSIVRKRQMFPYTLTGQDWHAVEAIRLQRYAAWDWNYGQSPDFSINKRRHVPGFGDIRISMEVKKGRISAVAAEGGFEFAPALVNTKLEKDAMLEALSRVPSEKFCEGISRDDFAQLIVE